MATSRSSMNMKAREAVRIFNRVNYFQNAYAEKQVERVARLDGESRGVSKSTSGGSVSRRRMRRMRR